jgi:hypothetical protein
MTQKGVRLREAERREQQDGWEMIREAEQKGVETRWVV